MSAPAERIHSQLQQAELADRQRALMLMLHRPLITSRADSESFRLIRRHAPWLQSWFVRHPGWTLHVDREVARLRKRAADDDDTTRAARDPTGQPFSRRRYVTLCLALAALERSDRQTVLGKLAEDIGGLYAEDAALAAAGVSFDLRRREVRRDLISVIRTLLHLGVLVRVQGDEEEYLDERGDVLYSIHRGALTRLLSVQRGPSTVTAGTLVERIAAISEEVLLDSDAERNRMLRSRLYRRLLDDPVTYYAKLSADERAYLDGQRARFVEQLESAAGLVPEVRAEGLAMTRIDADGCDVSLLVEGTDGHVTLLLAEFLADRAREQPGVPVSINAIHGHVAQLVTRHRSHWRRAVTLPGAERALAEGALERLQAFRLIQRRAEGVTPLAAIGRFALFQREEASA